MIARLIARLCGGDPKVDELIVPPRQIFEGFDPSLRERAAVRRERADKIRSAAARVVTGTAIPTEAGLRVVGRR